MKIVTKKISDLIEAEYNPRQLTKDQFKQITDSIKRFGIVDPIIVNKNKDRKNIIVGGHQRVKVAGSLGFKEMPCVEVDLTPEKERELNIRLNKNTGEWDWDALGNNFDVSELIDWGFDDKDLAFFDLDGMTDDMYSKNVESPTYQPINEKPDVDVLVNKLKVEKLINDIDKADISNEDKEFLKVAACRHYVFNYSKIADYYANSDKKVQKLMEDSALIIIDFNKAIELGYVELSNSIKALYEEEYA